MFSRGRGCGKDDWDMRCTESSGACVQHVNQKDESPLQSWKNTALVISCDAWAFWLSYPTFLAAKDTKKCVF